MGEKLSDLCGQVDLGGAYYGGQSEQPKKEEKVKTVICKCPKCDGDIVEKKTRRGKIFYGCDKYPKCDVALWDKPTGDICPECGSLLVEKKDEIKCSSCNYEK